MPPNILVFTGAPESAALDWDSPGLLDSFIIPISRFLGIPQPDDARGVNDTPTPRYASWRSLGLDPQQHLVSGYSQAHEWLEEYQGNAKFFTADTLSFHASDIQTEDYGTESFGSGSTEEVLSQFYRESFATHEDVVSSQVAVPLLDQHKAYSGSECVSRSDFNETSFATTSSLSLDFPFSLAPQNKPPAPVVRDLTSLSDIPNAMHLQSIQPQTMTVNLIVGIITISPPRGIRTRRGDNVDLVEMLVGDETKSGFGVNFWLRVSNKGNNYGNDDPLRDILGGLRPQDILLLKNVALSSFCGMVYGQSLRKDMTKVHLLYRNRVDRSDTGGCYAIEDLRSEQDACPQLTKMRHVREWVLRFVGPAVTRKSKGGKIEVIKEALPPDTQ